MRQWTSSRALRLHAAALVWVPACLVAGWWQVTRASGGNSLSYLYAVEWPILAVVGVLVWWVLVHTDPETVGARAQRRAAAASAAAGTAPLGGPAPVRRTDDEDPDLAAYNDRLAALSGRGPKTWRHR